MTKGLKSSIARFGKNDWVLIKSFVRCHFRQLIYNLNKEDLGVRLSIGLLTAMRFFLKFKIFLVVSLLVLFPKIVLADCQSWNSGKYKASNFDSDAMDDTVQDAFNIKNPKGALVSFDNCVFMVRPQIDAKLQTFDYSKDKGKCSSIKAIFEMNLIGCEQTVIKSNPGIKKHSEGAQ